MSRILFVLVCFFSIFLSSVVLAKTFHLHCECKNILTNDDRLYDTIIPRKLCDSLFLKFDQEKKIFHEYNGVFTTDYKIFWENDVEYKYEYGDILEDDLWVRKSFNKYTGIYKDYYSDDTTSSTHYRFAEYYCTEADIQRY